MAREKLIRIDPDRFKPEVLQTAQREGIIIEKGVTLTTEYLEKHEELLRKYFTFFSAYPDLYLDIIKPADSNFELYFYQRIVLRAMMRYKEVYIVACLNGDTPVLTTEGIVPIKDINPNSLVMSDGQWRAITNLNSRNWTEKKVRINADNCFYESIVATNDHQFLVVKRDKKTSRPGRFWKEGLAYFNVDNYDNRKEFYRTNLREVESEWCRADNLHKEDWLLSKIDIRLKDLEYLDVPQAPSRTQNIIEREKIEINKDFCEWFGIWLAEGSWTKSRISFTIADYEDRLKDRIIELSNRIFGLNPTIYHRAEKHTLILSLQSAHLSRFFRCLYNCEYTEINQWNKYIPYKLMLIAPIKQLQMVKGWLDGDGYYRKPAHSGRYKGTTVSGLLVENMKMILYRNFINPSITVEHRSGKKTVYNLNFNGRLAEEFERCINNNEFVEIDNSLRLGEYYPIKTQDGLYMRNRVSYIEIIEDNEDVYCLQLENGQFNVNGAEGHNCRAFSKSFLTILAIILQCIFIPGTKRFICAPNKNQAAQIAKEKIVEIYDRWPLLKKEIVENRSRDIPGNFAKDSVTLSFKNGSQFDVKNPTASFLAKAMK